MTELLSAGGIDIIHNVLYRAVKQGGTDVFLTAEREVAPRVAYIADNVIELVYRIYPYGALREAVVRKIRGGRAGFSMPFFIREGVGVVFLRAAPAASLAVRRLETGTCVDEAVGGLYTGLLHAIVGPVGSGKTWLMLRAAKSLKERGVRTAYIGVSGAGSVYAERLSVETIDVGLNVEELLAALISSGADAVFVRGLEALSVMYGAPVLYKALRALLQAARGGRAVVVSLRELHDLDILFDVVVKMEGRRATGLRGPGGRVGEAVQC